MGVNELNGRVRTSSGVDLASDRFQSDRMYPPYPYRSVPMQIAFDWPTGALRSQASLSTPSAAVSMSPNGQVASVSVGNPQVASARAMDPWVVVADWRHTGDARVAQECMYRDYWRTVLIRRNPAGVDERLFLDPKSGLPVKLERLEVHTTFGDALAEYLWTTWLKIGKIAMPLYSYRLLDGQVEVVRRSPQHALVPRDSAPLLVLPPAGAAAPAPVAAVPDTVRAGASTFLLVTPAYTNVVTLQRDTVFVLDAQTNEARARADSVWIGKLFPGRHAVVLVVTDLAWPHIGGVRFWAATGARIFTHRASKSFLDTVLTRRWTLAPDALERKRTSARVHLDVRAIDAAVDVAGGAVQLRPIDGLGSEGALMAYIPADRFLYAGDYVQQTSLVPLRPGFFDFTYPEEVIEATRRNGFAPERFAAMHVGITPWTTLLEKRASR